MKEFDLVENIKSRYGLTAVGDDCAVLPNGPENELLMTADLLIEGIDFELGWTTPRLIGHKALAVSLSDIAAMGGTPRWALLSLGIPQSLWTSEFIDEFYGGWNALASTYSVELVGGDISRSPDKFLVDSVVGGDVPKGRAIMRSGARPDDVIFVTGVLGGAAAGLKMLLNEGQNTACDSRPAGLLVLRQLQPVPQLVIGNLLQEQGLATAMIDLSDGLSSDLQHLIDASDVGAEIDLDALPIHRELSNGFDVDTCRDLALNGGEDFELLFTCAPNHEPEVAQLGCKRIGTIKAGENIIVSTAGALIEPRGFRHF
jgi:thiamine-monophosphate kinase